MLIGHVLLLANVGFQIVKLPAGSRGAAGKRLLEPHQLPVAFSDGAVVDVWRRPVRAFPASRQPGAVLPAQPGVRLRLVFAGDKGEQVDAVGGFSSLQLPRRWGNTSVLDTISL
ncbi:MAG: hypothetical protein ACI8W8_004770 [Rhodothermales bacterium]|jgi:hypothetical protein